MTEQEINEYLKDNGLTRTEMTCKDCEDNNTCPFAWDAYNTYGDCLMEK